MVKSNTLGSKTVAFLGEKYGVAKVPAGHYWRCGIDAISQMVRESLPLGITYNDDETVKYCVMDNSGMWDADGDALLVWIGAIVKSDHDADPNSISLMNGEESAGSFEWPS
jgi:hypothetical protein